MANRSVTIVACMVLFAGCGQQANYDAGMRQLEAEQRQLDWIDKKIEESRGEYRKASEVFLRGAKELPPDSPTLNVIGDSFKEILDRFTSEQSALQAERSRQLQRVKESRAAADAAR